MHRVVSGALASAVVVSLGVGCGAHVQIPQAPAKTAPVEDRITWAKRYNIVATGPVAGIADRLGTTESLHDMRDLRQGIGHDPYLDSALDALDGPMMWRTISSWSTIGLGAVFVVGWLATPALTESYGADHVAPQVANTVTTVAGIGTVLGFLWTNVTSADVGRAESRVRLMYAHVIEENLDVEIHPNGDITGRTTAAATVIDSTNALPTTLAPAPEPVPPPTTPPVVTPDPTTAPPVTTPTPTP
ncbi:MAG TPA: hypothetical protein VGF99_21555 [Myxococcota bacterium]